MSFLYSSRIKSSFPLRISSLYSQLHPLPSVVFAGPQQSTFNNIKTMPFYKRTRSGSTTGSALRRVRNTYGYGRKLYKRKTYRRSAHLSARGFIPRILNTSELKSVDVAANSLKFDSTGTQVLLNGVASGSAFYQRVGRKICMKSLYITGTITPFTSGATAISQSYCRVIVVYDSQANGVAPTWANVIQSYTAGGTPSNGVLDQFNLDNRERFRILADRRWDMPGFSGTAVTTVPSGNSSSDQVVKMFIKLRNLEVQFSADTAGIGSIATGSIYILSLSDYAPATNYYLMSYTARIRYSDN